MNAEATAFMYERLQLKVTRPEPIGYLCLSVSMPEDDKRDLGDGSSCFSRNGIYIYQHRRLHRRGHSWFWPNLQQSICHAGLRRIRSWWDPISGTMESHSLNQQWSKGWLQPETRNFPHIFIHSKNCLLIYCRLSNTHFLNVCKSEVETKQLPQQSFVATQTARINLKSSVL